MGFQLRRPVAFGIPKSRFYDRLTLPLASRTTLEIPISWFTDGSRRRLRARIKKKTLNCGINVGTRHVTVRICRDGHERMRESRMATMIERIVTNVDRPDIANVRSRSVRRGRATRRN